MIELQGRHVAVVGLGESGLAMARWVAGQGARVTVLDDRDAPPRAEALAVDVPGARLIRGPFSIDAIDGSGGADAACDLVAWSPGLSPLVGPRADFHRAARAAGLPVHGELDFFAAELARRAAQGYRPAVIAITGTNGKTTVTQLVGHLAAEAGLDVQTAGNIGPAMLDALRERIAADRLPQMWALELSSFQLALAGRFDCSASVVLNVTQDHLDWHGTMAHYRDSKLRIHLGSAYCLINLDDHLTDPARAGPQAPEIPGAPDAGAVDAGAATPRRWARGTKSPKSPQTPLAHAGFTLGEPTTAPAFGLLRDGGLGWLVEAVADDEAPTRRRRSTSGAFRLNRLMPSEALPLHGAHNHANVLAALALLRAAGVALAPMLRGLRDFEPGPHRCTLVAVVKDVEFYDDSKGTNVGATIAALSGLGRRCVLIAGGIGKGQDFGPLGPVVRRHARAVVLIGRDAPLLREALADSGVPLSDAPTMEAAVKAAASLARPGEAVLMSPACASFDMFRGYPHRAEVFVGAVRQVAEEAGQPC